MRKLTLAFLVAGALLTGMAVLPQIPIPTAHAQAPPASICERFRSVTPALLRDQLLAQAACTTATSGTTGVGGASSSGASGANGLSSSGTSTGVSGASSTGASGTSGTSGMSSIGASSIGTNGAPGASRTGTPGTSGAPGAPGAPGASGTNGIPGTSRLVLLAEFTVRAQGGSACCFPPGAALPTEFAFSLMYGFRDTHDGSKALGLNADIEVGATRRWTSGQTGVVDFSALNTPDFNALAARLTNGSDETISQGVLLITSAGAVGGGSTVGSGPERGRLGGTEARPDLAGSTISFVRLTVRKAHVTYTTVNTAGDLSQETEWDVTWQIFGSR